MEKKKRKEKKLYELVQNASVWMFPEFWPCNTVTFSAVGPMPLKVPGSGRRPCHKAPALVLPGEAFFNQWLTFPILLWGCYPAKRLPGEDDILFPKQA